MKELILFEIRKALRESEESNLDELIKLRAFHYNIHHIVYNPINDLTCQEVLAEIKAELHKFEW